MDAVKFIQENKRMCITAQGCNCCDIGKAKERAGEVLCGEFRDKHPLEFVAIVEKWSTEHPIKTNGVRFKEVYGYSFESLYNSTIIHEFGTCNASILAEWLSSPYEEPKE